VEFQRKVVERFESCSGHGWRVSGFEFSDWVFSVVGDGQDAMEGIEVLRGGADILRHGEPEVEPSGGFGYCGWIDVAEEYLEDTGDDGKFTGGEELQRRRKPWLHEFGFGPCKRRPALACAAEGVDEMILRGFVQPGRQLGKVDSLPLCERCCELGE